MTHITHHPVTEASWDYIDRLQAALNAAQAALEASQGREARLREALGELLTRQSFQPSELQGYPDTDFWCPECFLTWPEGQPEQHKADCKLVAWRKMAQGE